MENYKPKTNRAWQRKDKKICLRDLCLDSVMVTLCTLKVPIDPGPTDRLKDYLSSNVPPEVGADLLEFARRSFLSPKNIIRLMELLPKASYQTRVDLIGSYRGTECCKPSNSLNWLYGFIPEVAINLANCHQLYRLLTRADLQKLKSLSLWARPDSIKSSSIPNIVGRATWLTRLVLRGGASDHLLRIIGLNCHSLRHLDVSRSPHLTTRGLRNLFLLKPTSKEPGREARTVLASRLNTFLVSHSNLKPSELYMVSVYMNRAYIFTVLPEYQMSRIEGPERATGMRYSSKLKMVLPDGLRSYIGDEDWSLLQAGLAVTITTTDTLELDFQERTRDRIQVIIRTPSTFLVKGLFMLSPGLGITQLTLLWDRFNWDLQQLTVLSHLVRALPNLEFLQCRLYGGWEEAGPIFPRLRTVNCWTLDDSTAVAFLRHCPSLRTVDVKNVRAVSTTGAMLTHDTLKGALDENPGLKDSLEDIVIRPTNFTKESVVVLTESCPHLRRIGDLECWDVTEAEIAEVNGVLKRKNSACTLVVLSFPPQPTQVILD